MFQTHSPLLYGWFAVVCGLLFLGWYFHNEKYRFRGTQLPGPRGFPILGSVPYLPQKHPWLKFFEWSRKYGSIYQCNLAGENIVVISSPRIAQELLVHRSKIYSDRPSLPAIMHDVRTSMHYIPLLGEGMAHKRGRAFDKHMLSSTSRDTLAELSQNESRNVASMLIEDSDRWREIVQDHVARITAQVAWNDKDMETAKHSILNAEQLLPRVSPDGAIENKLPFLRYIPNWVPLWLQPWRREEIERYERERKFWFGQMEKVRLCKDDKSRTKSWMGKFLFTEDGRSHQISKDEEAAYAIGMMAMIGGVLLSSPLQSLLLALCHHPEWQRKAQEEVDNICQGVAPQASDIKRLPTVRALLRETLRWRPPVPLGVPHRLEQDDIYDEYLIPKGSICLAAEWAMTRDESLYPDAEAFRPDRWLDPKFPTYRQPLSQYPEIKNHSSFGWGNRSCVGQEFSEVVLFTMAATILWSCDVTKKWDKKTGNLIDIPWMDISPPNAIVRPTWFHLDVKARDKKAPRS